MTFCFGTNCFTHIQKVPVQSGRQTKNEINLFEQTKKSMRDVDHVHKKSGGDKKTAGVRFTVINLYGNRSMLYQLLSFITEFVISR